MTGSIESSDGGGCVASAAAASVTPRPFRLVYRRDDEEDNKYDNNDHCPPSGGGGAGGSSSATVASSTTTSASTSYTSLTPVLSLPIYYFGYGPIVHPLVRKRRGVLTGGSGKNNEKAAMLLEHRLTFAYGGKVNIVPQRGFQVHGILLRFDTAESWATFREFDAGYALNQVYVHPYPAVGVPPDLEEDGTAVVAAVDDDDGTPDAAAVRPIKAYTFVMNEFDETRLDKVTASTIEKLPEERYLKLIADGMRRCNIDTDYIEDHIMSVPYAPKTHRDEFRAFPIRPPLSSAVTANRRRRGGGAPRRLIRRLLRRPADASSAHSAGGGAVPTITLHDYQERLCRNAGPDQVYFVVGTKVVQIDPPFHPLNPCVVWFKERTHGQPDMTLTVHKTVVDPDIPLAYTEEELTPLHISWCENLAIEYMDQGGLRGSQIYELIPDINDDDDAGRSMEDAADDGVDGPVRQLQPAREMAAVPLPSLLSRCCLSGFKFFPASSSTRTGNSVNRTDSRSNNNNNNNNVNHVNTNVNSTHHSTGSTNRRMMLRPSILSNNSSSRSYSNNNSNNNNNAISSYFSSSELMHRNYPIRGADDDGGGTIHMDDDDDDDDVDDDEDDHYFSVGEAGGPRR